MSCTDPASPLSNDVDAHDHLERQVYPLLNKPPMTSSVKLAHQALRYMVEQGGAPGGIFPTFNAPQLVAVEAALTRRLTLIQGPPGSGKVDQMHVRVTSTLCLRTDTFLTSLTLHQTTVAAAIGFGFVHQCRSILTGNDENSNAKVLACAFSNVGADNLAEAYQRLGLKVVRVGRAAAVSETLWNATIDAAIDRDAQAQQAIQNAAKVTAQLSNVRRQARRPSRGGSGNGLAEVGNSATHLDDNATKATAGKTGATTRGIVALIGTASGSGGGGTAAMKVGGSVGGGTVVKTLGGGAVRTAAVAAGGATVGTLGGVTRKSTSPT